MEERNCLQPWHGLVASVLAILFMLFGGIPLYALFGEIGGLLAGVFLGLLGLAFVVMTRTKLSEVFPLRLPPVRQFFASIGLYIGVFFLNAAISVLLAQIIPQYQEREQAIDALITTLPPALAILLVAVQPAICEEFFCRGFLVATLRNIKSDWLIILLTSFFFGALHMDLYAFLPTALLGATFAYIALQTKSLLIPILLHFCNNALSVVLAYTMAGTMEKGDSVIASLSMGTRIAYMLFYLGLALLCIWFSSRWFLGKKVLNKAGLAVFIAAALLVSFGVGVMVITSVDIVTNESDVVTYTDHIYHEIPLHIEDGVYSIAVSATGSEPFRIVLQQDNEILKSTPYSNAPTLSYVETMETGHYAIVLLSEDGKELKGGSVVVTVIVMRQTQ